MKRKCWKSGEWARSSEAARHHLCPCGARIPVTPRHNPKVGGQTLHGWNVRVPAHKEGVKSRAHLGEAAMKRKPAAGMEMLAKNGISPAQLKADEMYTSASDRTQKIMKFITVVVDKSLAATIDDIHISTKDSKPYVVINVKRGWQVWNAGAAADSYRGAHSFDLKCATLKDAIDKIRSFKRENVSRCYCDECREIQALDEDTAYELRMMIAKVNDIALDGNPEHEAQLNKLLKERT